MFLKFSMYFSFRFYKIFKKGTKLVMVIRFFTNGKWHFDTENVKSLWKKLSETDKKLFNFDITSFTWDELLTAHCYGSKKYLLKTDMSLGEQKRAVRKATK